MFCTERDHYGYGFMIHEVSRYRGIRIGSYDRTIQDVWLCRYRDTVSLGIIPAYLMLGSRDDMIDDR